MPIPQPRRFVGRHAQLSQFSDVLADSQGRAVLIVGAEGMGKTTLALRLLEQTYPGLSCSSLIYEVAARDSLDEILQSLLSDAEFMIEGRSSFGTQRRRDQWRALLDVLPKGKEVGRLIDVFADRKTRLPREKFIAVLEILSRSLDAEQRVIFVIDPVTYLAPGSDEDWALIVRELPAQMIFLFPQRPDDVLANSRKLLDLPNITRLDISEFKREEVSELLDFCRLGHLQPLFDRFDGHPYAIGAAIDLYLDRGSLPESRSTEPLQVVRAQWSRICEHHSEAIPLFFAYAVLEVPVPDSIVRKVAAMEVATVTRLYNTNYLRCLLSQDDDTRRIYHRLLLEHVLNELGADAALIFHERAIEVYSKHLDKGEFGELCAVRLPHHANIMAPASYAKIVQKCAVALKRFGLSIAGAQLLEKALPLVDADSGMRANLYRVLGMIYRDSYINIDEGLSSYEKALAIYKQRGDPEGLAGCYLGLGNCYASLDFRFTMRWRKAEKNYRNALKIFEDLGNRKSVAKVYCNLGNVACNQGDLDKADQYYRNALSILEALGDSVDLANTLMGSGDLSEKRGDKKTAELLINKAFKIYSSLGYSLFAAVALIALGKLHQRQSELEKAEKVFLEALGFLEPLARKEKRYSLFVNAWFACKSLGEVYAKRGDVDAAERMHGIANRYSDGFSSCLDSREPAVTRTVVEEILSRPDIVPAVLRDPDEPEDEETR